MKVLKNCWYMIGWVSELDECSSLTRVVAGETLTVSKTSSSDFTAWGGGSVRREIAVVSRHRILWIWLGDAAQSAPSHIPDFSAFDDAKESAFVSGYLPTQANYELMSDNILDLSHADFLHVGTLNGPFTRELPRFQRDGQNLIVTWENTVDPTIPLFDMHMPEPGKPAHTKVEVIWYPAAVMALRSQAAPAGEPLEKWIDVRACHIMTPEDEGRTHYFYGMVRNYNEDDHAFNAFQAQALNHAFSTEDKPVVEAQQRVMGDADFWSLKPVLLPIDVGGVQARRTLAKLIAEEGSATA